MNSINRNASTHEPIFHEESLSVRLSGNHMRKNEGYNLDIILTSLGALESIAKKTYLHSKGATRFTKEDDNNFSIRLMEVKEGSFISDLKFMYSDIILPMIPFVVENKEIIWSSLKTTYDYLKTKISATKEGKSVIVNQTTDLGGTNINVSNVNNSTVHIDIYPGIVDLANKVAPDFANITKLTDGQKIDSVELIDDDNESDRIVITSADRELFSKSTYTDDNIFSLRGKIVKGDYKNLRGQIEVFETEADLIEIGTIYNFKVNNNLNAEEEWRQMFLEEKSYYCKKRIEVNPTKEKMIEIIEVIIVDWDESAW